MFGRLGILVLFGKKKTIEESVLKTSALMSGFEWIIKWIQAKMLASTTAQLSGSCSQAKDVK